jgi:threonine/homoserine/homoserine lactone efflux protein
VLTAFALHSILLVSEHALVFLRWAGAAYLVYLGCKQWRVSSLAAPQAAEHAKRGLFWRGFATSGLNPKSLLVFPSFFPQFIRADAPWSHSEQYLVLAATFTLVFAVGVSSVALFSHRLRTALQRPVRWRAFNRVSSALLVGMGALMAAVR